MGKHALFFKAALPLLLLASCSGEPASSSSEPSIESSSEPASSAVSSSSKSSKSSKSSSSAEPLPVGEKIPTSEQPVHKTEDHYRTMYQIMPYSFADSDGDGIGDLFGIVDKLDYLADLHYEGLWLTPVCPSPTYHKYDVLDYYDIDETFGGLGAYDDLVEGCHERNMTILFDLVLNHSALDHPWFKACCEAHIRGDTEDPYYEYFNIQERLSGGAWYKVPGSTGLAYEARFYSGMPDFNLQAILDNENGPLAEEFRSIFKFWLIDHDVDGFRLDAVTSYFTGDRASNLAFLTWLNKECRALKPNCYIVGEGNWTGNSPENQGYQASGVDAFFNFDNTSITSSYSVPSLIRDRKPSVAKYGKGMQMQWECAAGGIPANFIANHDTSRLAVVVSGRKSLVNAKMGHSFLQMLPGATYVYYGDELGMCTPMNNAGDPDIRLHMDWGDEYTPNDPPGAVKYDESKLAYPYPSAKEQLADPDSLLSHVRKVNLLRQQFPEIARGKTEVVDSYTPEGSNVTLALLSKVTEDSTIYLAINPSATNGYIYDFSVLGDVKPVAEVSAVGETTYENNLLYLAPGAVVVLK